VTVTDRGGLTASATVTVVVGNPPANQAPTVAAAADPGGGNAPLKVTFSASGHDPDGDALSYAWNFGDGGQLSGPKVSHTFTAAGTYTVTVTARDARGATGSTTLTVVVGAPVQRTAAGATGRIVSVRPASLSAFARRGLRAVVTCGSANRAIASVWVSRKAAKRLGLASRRLGAARVGCATGTPATVRVKPKRAVRKRLVARTRPLRVQLRLRAGDAAPAERSVTLKAAR
jgi:PKD repeat protein